MALIRAVTDADFNEHVLLCEKPVLVDFWADWCGPCKALAPTLELLAQEYGGVLEVAKLDVDNNIATRDRIGVRGLPTLALFSGGEEVARLMGNQSRTKIKSFLDGHLDADRAPAAEPEFVNPTSTFEGDHDRKELCIARLRGHAADQTAMPGPTVWDGQSGSPLGCATEIEFAPTCARVLGVSPTIVSLIDILSTFYGTNEAGNNWVLEWLETLPVGSDQSGLALATVAMFLDGAFLTDAIGDDEQLQAIRDRISLIHREAPGGLTVRGDWLAVRQSLADLPVVPGRRAAVKTLLAAAWPLSDEDMLRDLLGKASALPGAKVVAEMGWTAGEDERAMAALEKIHDETPAENRSPEAVNEAFNAAEPELAARFHEQHNRRIAGMRQVGQQVGGFLLDHNQKRA